MFLVTFPMHELTFDCMFDKFDSISFDLIWFPRLAHPRRGEKFGYKSFGILYKIKFVDLL